MLIFFQKYILTEGHYFSGVKKDTIEFPTVFISLNQDYTKAKWFATHNHYA